MDKDVEWLRQQAEIAESDGVPEEATRLREIADRLERLIDVCAERERIDDLHCGMLQVIVDNIRYVGKQTGQSPTGGGGV